MSRQHANFPTASYPDLYWTFDATGLTKKPYMQTLKFGPHDIPQADVFAASTSSFAFVNLKPLSPGGQLCASGDQRRLDSIMSARSASCNTVQTLILSHLPQPLQQFWHVFRCLRCRPYTRGAPARRCTVQGLGAARSG